MRRASMVFLVLAVSIVGTGSPSALGQETSRGLEQELKALVQVTTRLVESLDGQGREAEADRDLRRVAVAVQVLDIRARRQDGLRKELQELDDREQQFLGYLAANEVRVENLDRQVAEATDESKLSELKARRAEIDAQGKNHKQQLEHVARRRGEIDGLLVEGRRSVEDVESIVKVWLADLAQRPTKQSGK